MIIFKSLEGKANRERDENKVYEREKIKNEIAERIGGERIGGEENK
tara:strand:+ start:392 stop:529 length:138 start_codon:yes stop_codon:yes gene_type:complete